MKLNNILDKILNPNHKSKKEMKRLGLIVDESGYDTSYYSDNTYGPITVSTSGNTSSNYYQGYVKEEVLDIDKDADKIIIVKKDSKSYEMTREELYRLKFMLDEEGETIDSSPLEMFLNYLTAVKI